MRIHWGFCAASVAVAALVVSSQLSQPSTAPCCAAWPCCPTLTLHPVQKPCWQTQSWLMIYATAAGEESEDIARLIGPAKITARPSPNSISNYLRWILVQKNGKLLSHRALISLVKPPSCHARTSLARFILMTQKRLKLSRLRTPSWVQKSS